MSSPNIFRGDLAVIGYQPGVLAVLLQKVWVSVAEIDNLIHGGLVDSDFEAGRRNGQCVLRVFAVQAADTLKEKQSFGVGFCLTGESRCRGQTASRECQRKVCLGDFMETVDESFKFGPIEKLDLVEEQSDPGARFLGGLAEFEHQLSHVEFEVATSCGASRIYPYPDLDSFRGAKRERLEDLRRPPNALLHPFYGAEFPKQFQSRAGQRLPKFSVVPYFKLGRVPPLLDGHVLEGGQQNRLADPTQSVDQQRAF